MILRTCTKVNVGLNVMRRRPDGYHDIETLFVPYYGWSDVLDVEPAEELSIEIEREGGVDWNPMDDLTVRAWRLLKGDFPQLPPVRIGLQKFAPVGAGLGGGSADAAFMLRALNEIGSLGLSDAELACYAARLGSDCAFFIGLTPTKNIPLHPQGTEGRAPQTPPVADASNYCQPMFATGRGEILEAFDIDLSGYEIRVEIPRGADGEPVAVSTREAYGGIVPRESKNLLPLREALKLPVEQWRGRVVNDFEATVCPLHPQIPALIADFYRRGASYAAMSGSGSSVFGLFRK